MAHRTPAAIQQLSQLFKRLPGIGPKVAERFVYYFLQSGKGEVQRFIDGLQSLMRTIKTCEVCQTFAETSPCGICADTKRDATVVCVVALPSQIQAIEKTGFTGMYHVLRGVINPSLNIGHEQLRIEQLRERTGIKELILGLNPDIDGEATMAYIQRLYKDTPITITRLARGLPLGSDIEYADEVTLSDAIANRREM